MKQLLSGILLFINIYSFSQENQVKITLESDSIITTDWIKLNEFPTLFKPYVRIDNPSGLKIKLQDIRSYKGYDQEGNFRQLSKINLNKKGKFRYTELTFKTDSTDKVKIYHNNFTFGLEHRTSNERLTQYQFNDDQIKKLNYNNIMQDFSESGYSSKYLTQVKNIKILQYASLSIATGLLGYYIFNNQKANKNGFMDNDMILFTAGILYVVPFTLEKPKKKKLIESLKNYN
ncbi:hypothetical protein ACE1ET_10735 [Saccharicrinis sp. FJH62]|uniref:hypothetical protein n=1 Tax=Saccharicrinis sp. FJH62 TaxID=3344657 RepID=UPI0035D3F1C8